MLGLFKVTGDSMLPTMAAGDYVLTSRWYWSLKTGDLILVDHPRYGRIIKRIAEISSECGLWLSGDGPKSVTPADIGWVKRTDIIAKVIFTITPSL